MVGITVVVPVWNGRAFLAKALNSVRQQEKSPWPVQLIVVEDGTPAGADSEDIAQAYHAEYHYLWPNQGVAHARRFGAGLSVFDEGYLSFLDQDDFWHPPFLFQMTDALSRDSSKGFAVSHAGVIFPGEKYRLYQTKFPSLRLPDLKMFNHIVTPSQVLLRLSSFRRSGWTGELESPGADGLPRARSGGPPGPGFNTAKRSWSGARLVSASGLLTVGPAPLLGRCLY